jgi:hypothetical protein
MRLLLLALAVTLWSSSAAVAAPVLPTNFVDETLLTSLAEPISMSFLPDGRLVFTERATAKVRMMVNGHVALADPVLVVSGVRSAEIEDGLQGIAVDPRWPQAPYIYVCYTGTDATISLVRYTGSGDLTNPAGENLTFGSPYKLISVPDLNSFHNGLGLRFGADGHLLMTVGEDGFPCAAQDSTTWLGKLLRLDVTRLPAGSGGPPPKALLIPPNNPFTGPDSISRLVYAYGLRNPWRFHIDPSTGAILVADVGWNTYEELDEVFPGDNFGWPFREGLLVHPSPGCLEPGGPGTGLYEAPILALDRATDFTCITTAGVYRPVTGAPANWPSVYWGNLFYGDFYTSRLRRLVRSGASWVAPTPVPGQPSSTDWALNIDYSTDWLVGPDGSLYWLKMWENPFGPSNGMLRRIRYVGPPVFVDPMPALGRRFFAAPNPFQENAVLSWRLAAPGVARIEIFDLSGRRVRRLEEQTAGVEGRTTWDGRDDLGRPVPAAVYVARLTSESETKTVHLLRLK